MAVVNPTLRGFVVDALERVVFTFVEAFLALYTPVILSVAAGSGWHDLLNLSLAQKSVVAGIAAVCAVAKSLAAQFVGDANSPGFLPGWAMRGLKIARVVKTDVTLKTDVTPTQPVAGDTVKQPA